jgi:hypothetical protein
MIFRSTLLFLAAYAFVDAFAPPYPGIRHGADIVGRTTTATTSRFVLKTDEETKTEKSAVETESSSTVEGGEVVAPDDAKAKMASLMKPIKEAGAAGAVSLFLWEGAFWVLSIPVCSILYYQATGSWPDWSDKEDIAKVTAEAFAFANIARFALPLRITLAVSTTPWVKENIVDRFGLFQSKDDKDPN